MRSVSTSVASLRFVASARRVPGFLARHRLQLEILPHHNSLNDAPLPAGTAYRWRRRLSRATRRADLAVVVLLLIAEEHVAMIDLALTATTSTAQTPHSPRWHGYGFLPGYHQPPNNSLPAYARKASASRMASRNRRPWYIDPVPSYYGYDGDWHYFGRPGFYGGRYNGGSFGPCWTRTPIGPIWNCG